jgi:hypothetical protein
VLFDIGKMNSKIAPLAPLTLTPSNSKGKGGLAPLPGLSTPASLDKLEKPKSRGDRSTNKSTTEKKKARKAKMEKLRQSKHATHIQAVWRGSRARKVGIEKHEEEKIVEPLSHSCEKSEERAVIEEGSGEISPETIDSKGSTTRTDSDEMLKKTCVEPKLQDNAVISNISTADSREGSSLRKEGGQEETLTCPIEDSDIVPVKDKDITKCEMMDTNEVDGSTKKEILPEVDSAVSSTPNVELGATTEDQKEHQDKDELKAQQLDQQQGESTEDADSRKPSVWPDSHHDSFTTIGDTEVAWPDLTNSNPESVLQWVLQHQQVLIRTVTWNMQANDPPPVDEVRKTLLPLNRYEIVFYCFIIVFLSRLLISNVIYF